MRLPLLAILSFALEMTKIHVTLTVLFVLSLFYGSPASSRTLKRFPKTTVLNVSALFAMTTQILSVNQNTFETQDQEKLQQQSDSSMTLKLYSRDILSLTSFNNYEDRTLARLKRDAARVNFISKKLNKGGFSPVDVKTRLVPASAEYIARFEIGTPPRPVYVVIDTGSEITWLQCSPCTSCYNQTNPIFDPAKSSSYKPLSCDSRQCKDLDHSSCSHSKCYYHLTYGDGSTSVGDFATEKFAFGGTISEHVAMGCGHENKVSFVQADGLLGLGDGPLSFLSQINQKSFSYCLVYRDSGSDSTLSFGSSIDRDAVTTSLLGDMKPFYASTLTAICVGRILFNITYKGHHGVTAIVDTGTSVTRFPSFIYKPVRDEFVKGVSLPSAGAFKIFDACFRAYDGVKATVPFVAFHFGEKVLVLPAKNLFIAVNDNTICFAFATFAAFPSDVIIGNIQQQGFRVSFDLAKSVVGFSANKC